MLLMLEKICDFTKSSLEVLRIQPPLLCFWHNTPEVSSSQQLIFSQGVKIGNRILLHKSIFIVAYLFVKVMFTNVLFRGKCLKEG